VRKEIDSVPIRSEGDDMGRARNIHDSQIIESLVSGIDKRCANIGALFDGSSHTPRLCGFPGEMGQRKRATAVFIEDGAMQTVNRERAKLAQIRAFDDTGPGRFKEVVETEMAREP